MNAPASANQLFRVALGDYEFAIDRKTLTIRFVETRTGTVWADFDVATGFAGLENRETREFSRHDLADAKLVSLSEKSGPDGKRILFGLDLFGVPIDVYFTCDKDGVQLTVEANRDSATHTVQQIGLLPGLCAVPMDEPNSVLVFCDESNGLYPAREVSDHNNVDYDAWSSTWTMLFWGAVRLPAREASGARSALFLTTDSAEAILWWTREPGTELFSDNYPNTRGGTVAISNVVFNHKEETDRRRLEVRIVPLPDGDPVALAKTYRDLVIERREHVPLRRKIREQPTVERLIGAPLIFLQNPDDAPVVAQTLAEMEIQDALLLLSLFGPGFRHYSSAERRKNATLGEEDLRRVALSARAAHDAGCLVGVSLPLDWNIEPAWLKAQFGDAVDALHVDDLGRLPYWDAMRPHANRWAAMDAHLDYLRRAKEAFAIVGTRGAGDWSAIGCDFWTNRFWPRGGSKRSEDHLTAPLSSVVYHDSVVTYAYPPLHPDQPRRFLRALLTLGPPSFQLGASCLACDTDVARRMRQYARETCAVLCPLHKKSFASFLVAHQFLTDDGLVEEAIYSNGIRVVVNQSSAEPYTEVHDCHVIAPMGWRVVEDTEPPANSRAKPATRGLALPLIR